MSESVQSGDWRELFRPKSTKGATHKGTEPVPRDSLKLFAKLSFKKEYGTVTRRYIIAHIMAWLTLLSLIGVDFFSSFLDYKTFTQFFQLPEHQSIFLLVLKCIVYLGQLICLGFRSYQLKCHYYQLGYYRPHFMQDWVSDALSSLSYGFQTGVNAILPYLINKSLLFVVFILHFSCTCFIFITLKVSYFSMLKHHTAENTAPMPPALATEFRITALKRRQIVPSTRYYTVSRVFGVHLGQNIRAAHATIYIMEAYHFLAQVLLDFIEIQGYHMLSKGDVLKNYSDFYNIPPLEMTSADYSKALNGNELMLQNYDELNKSPGHVALIVFLIELMFVMLFSWFWYENFVLKDIGVIYTSPWIMALLIVVYGAFKFSDSDIFYGNGYFGEQQSIARDIVVGTILVGLALKIVFVKEITSEAPAKEAEDDFSFARTRKYRHLVGNRGAQVDKTSMPSFSISESESSVSKMGSENYANYMDSSGGNLKRSATPGTGFLVRRSSQLSTPASRAEMSRRASNVAQSALDSRSSFIQPYARVGAASSTSHQRFLPATITEDNMDSPYPRSTTGSLTQPSLLSAGHRSSSVVPGKFLTTDAASVYRRTGTRRTSLGTHDESEDGEINI